jgi:hypothetical protein
MTWMCVSASSAVDRGFEPLSGHTKDYAMIQIWRELTDFVLCPKNKNLIFVSCEKYIAVGEMIVFCVVFCRSVITM